MKTTAKIFLLLLLVSSAQFALADSWTQKATFPGPGRSHPFSFAVGNKGYVGGGDGLSDFWEYDQPNDAWTQKANFPVGSGAGVGWCIGDKGYALSMNTFCEFDPATNTWTARTPFPGAGRDYASGFTIGRKLYLVGGWLYGDCWEWDQSNNTWTQKASLPFTRGETMAFAINGKGYFGTGENNGFHNDVWEYDPAANTWTQRANIGGVPRIDIATFVICNYAYAGVGGESPFYRDLWQYDPVADQWVQKANFGGAARDDAAFFAIGKKGYIGLGQSSTNYTDFWEYTPDNPECITATEEIVNTTVFSIYPNPSKSDFVLSFGSEIKKGEVEIYNMVGERIYSEALSSQLIHLDVPQGIYFVELREIPQGGVKVRDGEKMYRQKLVVE